MTTCIESMIGALTESLQYARASTYSTMVLIPTLADSFDTYVLTSLEPSYVGL